MFQIIMLRVCHFFVKHQKFSHNRHTFVPPPRYDPKKMSYQSTFGIIKAQNTQLSFVNGFMELSSDEANRSERNQTEVGVFKRLAVKPLQ